MDKKIHKFSEIKVDEKGVEYREIKIPGKHGEIYLQVPIKEDTQEEIDAFYRTMAEVVLNNLRRAKQNDR
jgi:hypothetical protein